MSDRLWQTCAGVAIAVTLVLVGGDLLHTGPAGAFGARSRSYAHVSVVDSVEPGSPAARAGIVVGDKYSLARNDLASRVRLNWPSPGDRIVVDIDHAGRHRTVELVAVAPATYPWSEIAIFSIYETLRLVMLAVAGLIVARRPDLPAARALANFFIAFAFGFVARPPWYQPVVTALLDLVRPIAVFFAFEQAALFAAIFPRPSLSGPRRFVERICPYVFAVVPLVMAVTVGRYYATGIDPGFDPNPFFAFCALLFVAMTAVGFVQGAHEATPAERYRLRWISVSVAIGFSGLFAYIASEVAGVPQEKWILLPLTLIAIPLGTTYAILRHRVLDVGFVINRALVFAGISGIVVLAFALLEWLLGKYLVEIGHVGSSLVEAALALTLAFSLRGIHARVDHFVDNVFFRQRHLAERALRRLAHEVAFIDDEQIVVERTIEAVDLHAQAEGSAIYLADGREFARRIATLNGAPEQIDVNDPAIVAMRAFHDAVDLGDAAVAPSAFAGALCFPMLVRGELIGVLNCGPKREQEEYDPDERESLSVLARAVGHAVDSIRTNALRAAVDRTLAGDATLDDLRAALSNSGVPLHTSR